MTNLFIYPLLMTTAHLQLANIFGEPNLSYQEVAALLGLIALVGGFIIKVFYKDDAELNNRVEKLELKLTEQSNQIKDIIKEFREMVNRLEAGINQERDRDNSNIDKAIEKIESRLEKLSDYIMKLIEKL